MSHTLVTLLPAVVPALLLAGCLSTHRGLVQVEGDRALLVESDGKAWRVAGTGPGALVPGLEGCEVELEARRGGGRLHVQDWEVISAPGGGQPFVGRLRLYGSNWLIDDRSTGREVILDLSDHPELARHAGQVVLVQGYVAGAQTVRIMSWRQVSPDATPAGAVDSP